MKTPMRHLRPTLRLKTSLRQSKSEKSDKRKIKYAWVKTSLEVTRAGRQVENLLEAP